MPLLPMGPKELWEIELEKIPRLGLIALATTLITCRGLYEPFDRKSLMELLQREKRWGKHLNVMARMDEYTTDPERATRKWVRQQKAAKKAARTRKRERKVK